MSDYTDIEVEIDDPVALIRLNRPDKLNAFTYHTLGEIRSAIDAAGGPAAAVGSKVREWRAAADEVAQSDPHGQRGAT